MFKIPSHAIVYLIINVVCLSFCMEPKVLFALNSNIQEQEVRTITADKLKSRQIPKKEKRENPSKTTAAPQTPLPSMFCSLSLLLLLDDVKQIRIVAFNGPANGYRQLHNYSD